MLESRPIDLDSPDVYARIDSENMRAQIRELGSQCRIAWLQGLQIPLPAEYATVDKVVILGMGGSAMAGDLARAVVADTPGLMVYVARGYDLPAFVDARTLVVASSYSGNTEETLSAFQQALETPAKKLIITGGGRLAEIATERGIPLFQIQYRAHPRVALAHSLFPMLATFQKLGLVADLSKDVEEAASLLEMRAGELNEEVPVSGNAAKALASRLGGKLPVVYGAAFLDDVARRWKTQFAENSKSWAFYELLPELNHNSVAGFRYPDLARSNLLVIMLRAPGLSPRLLKRYQVTAELLEQAAIEHEYVDARGESRLAQMMSLVIYGDYVSYYLAILNNVDPSPVTPIGYLKRRLEEM